MRNPDPGPKRYTSLAWAAAEGNEEMFEFLLDVGHDDDELSRVRPTIFPFYLSLTRQLLIGFREQHDSHSTCRPETTSDFIIRSFRPRFHGRCPSDGKVVSQSIPVHPRLVRFVRENRVARRSFERQ